MPSPLKVLISGAAGQIGYSLIPLVASGQVFGPNQPITLVLFDIPKCETVLKGVQMEIQDCAYELIDSLIVATDANVACKGVQVAILVGGFPRGPGMERKDLMDKNKPIFVATGKALNDFADRDCKVLVVANPANTNCLVALTNAPSLPTKNFTALTRLDQNRAAGMIAEKISPTMKVSSSKIKNIIIWGNHSKTQVPDASNAIIESGKPIAAVSDGATKKWLEEEFVSAVQNRGAAVIAARGLSSALSAANAIKDHLVSWLQGTPAGQYVSMGVFSTGNPYNVAPGLVYSFPVSTKPGGQWTIQAQLKISPNTQSKMAATEKELIEERNEAGISV